MAKASRPPAHLGSTPVAASACRHLEPVESHFYYSWHNLGEAIYRTLLAEVDGQQPVLQMVRTGKSNEFAVYVIERGGEYHVVARMAEEAVWETAHRLGDYDYRSERWEAALDQKTTDALLRVWVRFVSRVRVPMTGDGFSDPEYYFSTIAGIGWVTGFVRGPKPGSCLNEFAMLGEALFAFAQATPDARPAELVGLRRRLASLERMR